MTIYLELRICDSRWVGGHILREYIGKYIVNDGNLRRVKSAAGTRSCIVDDGGVSVCLIENPN